MKIDSFTTKPLLIGILALSACHSHKGNRAPQPTPTPTAEEETDAVSSQPDQVDWFFTTIQLSLPPLLSEDAMVGGKVNPELAEKVRQEHAEFRERLEYISRDIRILYEYEMVLNGFALLVPGKYADRLDQLVTNVNGASFKPRQISRVKAEEKEKKEDIRTPWGDVDSAAFINAKAVHERYNIKGEGIRVGVIDTGIDYTHKMFGGAGTPDAYASNDPSVVADDFPTAKVVGGYDFVGPDFDVGSESLDKQTPNPDPDPLDESGHGTHVAGTIAGLGDGVNTYDGVAPQAQLFALKVFGISGSTSDYVVIAAMEYAADPDNNLEPSDRLDVVNLSLGGGFGTPYSLYDTAVKNLTAGGTVAVISAGNSGDTPFIVGSPSTAPEAISVAASVDKMDHNWKEPAGEVFFPSEVESGELVKVAYGSIGSSYIGHTARGKLVSMGLASEAPSAELIEQVTGNIALIERGAVAFCVKAENAVTAGAVGFVVYNSISDAPISMSGDCEIGIPGVMIEKEVGERIIAAMETGDVSFVFDPGRSIEFPDRIDKITSFSSRGPRSIDALLKPEISAPGQAIVSAAIGSGDQGVMLSGTSMAAPHVAGVAALIRQQFPDSTTKDIKSRIMNASKPLEVAKDVRYPLARQGAGRVDVLEAIESSVTIVPPAISLGHVNVVKKQSLAFKFELTNTTDVIRNFDLAPENISSEWTLDIDKEQRSITLSANETVVVHGTATIEPKFNADSVAELDGYILVKESGVDVNRLPIFGVRHRNAVLKADHLKIAAASANDANGAAGELLISNDGEVPGLALPFNVLSTDERQESNNPAADRSNCDLQSVGYRLVESWSTGTRVNYLEFAFKLYGPLTNWGFCQPTALLDTNNDAIPDYEVFGGFTNNYTSDFDIPVDSFSILVDAIEMKRIRKEFDTSYNPAATLDFGDAIKDLQPFDTFAFSTLAIIRLDLAALPEDLREAKVMAGVLDFRGGSKNNDFISEYQPIFSDPFEASFFDFSSTIEVGPLDYETTRLTKGIGDEDLIIYYPQNAANLSVNQNDRQSEIVQPSYTF